MWWFESLCGELQNIFTVVCSIFLIPFLFKVWSFWLAKWVSCLTGNNLFAVCVSDWDVLQWILTMSAPSISAHLFSCVHLNLNTIALQSCAGPQELKSFDKLVRTASVLTSLHITRNVFTFCLRTWHSFEEKIKKKDQKVDWVASLLCKEFQLFQMLKSFQVRMTDKQVKVPGCEAEQSCKSQVSHKALEVHHSV